MSSTDRSPTASSRPSRARRASAPDWQQLDRQLCFALYSASLAMTKIYKPLLEPLAVTYPQYLALLTLWEHDGVTVGELGERLFLDSGTLTPLLKRLEAAGLVQRQRDSADERRVAVNLTAAGRALQRRARDIPPRLAEATRCSLDEVAALTERLQQLRAQLQDSHAAQASH